MKQILFGSLFVVILCTAQALEFRDCGSKIGKFSKISVSNCDENGAACILRKLTNATISIDFTPDVECKEIKTVVHGIIMGVEMPFPLSNPDACVGNSFTCPVEKDTSYEYTATLPILKIYPKVKVDVKWQLKNENGDDIVCVLIPAKIE